MRLARHSIGIRFYDSTATDRYGDPVPAYLPEVEARVFAIGPRVQAEPETGRMVVVTGKTIYAPVDEPRPGPHDRVVIDGEVYEVGGEVADWTEGPYGARLGVAYDVQRVEG